MNCGEGHPRPRGEGHPLPPPPAPAPHTELMTSTTAFTDLFPFNVHAEVAIYPSGGRGRCRSRGVGSGAGSRPTIAGQRTAHFRWRRRHLSNKQRGNLHGTCMPIRHLFVVLLGEPMLLPESVKDVATLRHTTVFAPFAASPQSPWYQVPAAACQHSTACIVQVSTPGSDTLNLQEFRRARGSYVGDQDSFQLNEFGVIGTPVDDSFKSQPAVQDFLGEV